MKKHLLLTIALFATSVCFAQTSSDNSTDNELDLLRRQVEALEEQNRLLKKQVSETQTEKPEDQSQGVKEENGLPHTEAMDEQIQAVKEQNESPIIDMSSSFDLSEVNNWLDENDFGYKTFATTVMTLETMACLQVMDMAYEGVKSDKAFEAMFGWKPKREDRWSVQQKIIDDRKAFEVYVTRALGRGNLDNMNKMLATADMTLSDPKSEVSELLGLGWSDVKLTPEQETRIEEVVESFFH